jgi:hypothetical protein
VNWGGVSHPSLGASLALLFLPDQRMLDLHDWISL